MTAGEYCNREVMIVEPETSITEVSSLMREYHVGTLVVVDQAGNAPRPIGVITDRDLVIELLAQEVPADSVTIKDVINKELVCVTEQETLLNCIELMRSKGIRRLVVTNDNGTLQGILTADDALELIAEAVRNLSHLVGREIANEQALHP
jgi:CBS domain-containing protein